MWINLPSSAATLDNLAQIEGRAALIGGRIVPLPRLGYRSAAIADANLFDLIQSVRKSNRGLAFPGRMAFAIPGPASGR